jgi:hypothetical protein
MRSLIAGRDEATAKTVSSLQALLDDREHRLAERSEAVEIRDRIIEDLRYQLEPIHRKVMRWFREKRG